MSRAPSSTLERTSSRRRRISSSSTPQSLNSETRICVATPRSRIKPQQTKDSEQPQSSEQTLVSNGKIVDARSSFATLGIAPWLLVSLAGLAIQRPTAIQKSCIPAILGGQDVVGGSQTGTGKTIAFAVPILQKWAEDPVGVFAVVLTPTRYGWSLYQPNCQTHSQQ